MVGATVVLGLAEPGLGVVGPAETPGAALHTLIASTDPAMQAQVRAALLAKAVAGGLGETSSLAQAGPGQIEVLNAIAGSACAGDWLAEPLAALARDGDPGQRVAAVRALGAVRCRASLAALVNAARDRNEPSVADAALAALARLTGRSDLGANLDAWTALLAKVEGLSEEAWQASLASWLAARVESATGERDAVTARLVDMLRARVLSGVLPSDRTAALAEMLADSLPAVRRAGYALAMSELANARTPGDAVVSAAADGLKDDLPDLRRGAAELLAALAAPSTSDALAAAAKSEEDPSVAAHLLRALGRVRPPGCLEPAVMWAERDGVALAPALEAVAALAGDGPVDDAIKARVLKVIAARPLTESTAAGLRLACVWGTDADRAEVTRVLATSDPGVRASAAEALSADARGLDPLLTAAAGDAALFETTARAVRRFRPTAAGFTAVASLPAPSPDVRATKLDRIAAELPVADLVAVAGSTPDAGFREGMLSRLVATGTPPTSAPAAGDAPTDQAAVEGLLMLARTRLELNQPALAIKALDAMDAARPTPVQRAAGDAVRVLAYCSMDRVEDADKMDVPALPWVEALERTAGTPQAGRVLAVVERRFGLQLESELVARVDAVRRKIGAVMGPEMEKTAAEP